MQKLPGDRGKPRRHPRSASTRQNHHELEALRRRVAELEVELELEKRRHAVLTVADVGCDRGAQPDGQASDPLRGEAYLERVRRSVLQIMQHVPPTLELIAQQMHSSSRTVQRRLRLLGTTHRRLVEELRKELAIRYVESSALSITEIAYLLGYSDVSGFRRAFKKWTGRPPARAREHGMTVRSGP